ncbi:MAG: PAS domain S-box protein [Nitrospinales bacterium]
MSKTRPDLEVLISNLPGMVYRCHNDRDWTFEYASDACENLTGYKASYFVNRTKSFTEVIHPDDRDYVWNTIQQALKNRDPFQLKYRIRDASGKEKIVSEKGRGIHSESGELLALEGFITDITEKNSLEEKAELRYQRQKVIAGFSETALEGMDPLDLIKTASNHISTILKPDLTEVLEFLYGSQGFIRRYGIGWNEELNEATILNQEERPQAAYTIRLTDTVIVDDYASEIRFPAPNFIEDFKIQSGITCAIKGKTHPYGILGVYSKESHQFSQDEIYFLESISHIIAWAIRRKNVENKLKLFTIQLEKSRDEILRRSSEITETNERLKNEIINREHAEKEITESEDRLDSIINSAVDGIVVIDDKGTVLLFNPAAEKLFSYPADEVLNRNVNMLMPDPYKSEHDGYLQSYMETGKAKIIGIGREVIGLRKDNSTFDMDLAISEMIWHGNRVFLGIIRDITERNRSRNQLKEYANKLEKMVEQRTVDLNKSLEDNEASRNQLDTILKSIGDGLIVTNNQNHIILMNRAAEDMLDTRLSESINQSIDSAIKNNELKKKIKTAMSQELSDSHFDFDLTETHRNRQLIIRARTSQIHDQNGLKLGNVTIMNDVTHEREVDRMKSDFISTAAHEFRTPLTAIRGFSEILLKRENLDEQDQKDYLTYIHEETLQLNNLISDLLDISKIESGLGFTLNKSSCDVRELIQSTVNIFDKQYDKYNFPIVIQEKNIEWKVDVDKINQVLQNLFSNAVKYSPEGGTVKTIIKEIDSNIQISIQDQGLGLTEEQISRIFEKFYRVDSSNTAIQGTGLGMTIVKYILEAHGGKIWIDSELNKGTTINFSIPIT